MNEIKLRLAQMIQDNPELPIYAVRNEVDGVHQSGLFQGCYIKDIILNPKGGVIVRNDKMKRQICYLLYGTLFAKDDVDAIYTDLPWEKAIVMIVGEV